MSGKRIVEERDLPCEHGITEGHRVGAIEWCVSGTERRVLTEGQYVLIEKVDGYWPDWAVGYLDMELFESDDDEGQLACVILDALSDHTEGTP